MTAFDTGFAPAFGNADTTSGPTPPELVDFKTWLDLALDDTTDDPVLQQALDAAYAAISMLITYPGGVITADIKVALFMHAQRLFARRNSPEGIVGFSDATGDFVAARVPAVDADIVRILGPYLNIPVA